MKQGDIGLAIGVQFLWGFAFTLGKPAVAQFPALLLMALIYGVTVICLCPYIRRIKTPFWPLFILTAFTATLQEGLVVSGLALLPESTTVLMIQLFVPFSVLFAWIAVRERPTLVRAAGTTIAFLGVIIIVGAPDANLPWFPSILIVSGTAFGAAGTVMARRYSRDDGLALTVGISGLAVPQLLLGSILVERGQIASLLTASPWQWVAVVVIAVGGIVAGYSIWYGLLRRNRVEQLVPFGLLMPVVGVLLGILLLGEKPTVGELVGGAVILIGLATVSFGKEPLAVAPVEPLSKI